MPSPTMQARPRPSGLAGVAGVTVELLPGALNWAPALPRGDGAADAALGHILKMDDHFEDKHFRGGRYQVCHYSPSAVGSAYGPLALDQVLSFCRLLEGKLKTHGLVTVATKPGDDAGRANAAVLVGAFLILLRGWSVQTLREKMCEEANRTFPCSWSRQTPRTPPAPQGAGGKPLAGKPDAAWGVLTVRACWEGVEMALRVGWLQGDIVKDEFATSLVCSQYRRTLQEYDACWLAPGKLMVCADPITVVRDPNPSTCCHLTPPEKSPSLSRSKSNSKEFLSETTCTTLSGGRRLSVVSTASTEEHSQADSYTESPIEFLDEECWDIYDKLESMSEGTVEFNHPTEQMQAGLPATATLASAFITEGCNTIAVDDVSDVGGNSDADDSVHTVCKDYGDTMVTAKANPHPPQDFVTWCRSHDITQVVRVNFRNEPGLKSIGGSYSAQTFEAHGIRHLDVPVHDHGGGVPDKASINEVLEACKDVPASQAKLIHCKGGFGRSVLVACCHLIEEFDIPGAALLGWARIARPGAITTPQQERFLCQFRGAADMKLFLKAKAHDSVGAAQGCCTIS